jgi:hypothetical protein
VVIRKETNEGGMLAEIFQTLMQPFPMLFEICSLEAGFCSLANADRVHQAGKAYLFGLKGNQPELLAEAQRLLAEQTCPEVCTGWECYQGKKIRYRLYRSSQMAGYLDWSHLEQVWRVEKQILEAGSLKVENRYYVTNLHRGRLKAEQSLRLVRDHWGIEDHCYWSLDVIWEEDTKAWSSQGLAIQVLGLLRLMAYNLVGHLRCRYLRQRQQKRRWREWFDLLFWVITQPAGACGKVAAAGT